MTPDFHILRGLFLRAPLLSYTDYGAALPLENPCFRLALYLASPGFYKVLETKNFDAAALNEKEKHTLEKYFNRMSFRPTPFGLFSSFTLTGWGDDHSIRLAAPENALLHLRADQQAATVLSNGPGKEPAVDMYDLNLTLYRVGHEFRYIKTSPEESGTKFSYSLESIEANPLVKALQGIFKRGAKSGQQIMDFVQHKTGCGAGTAREYLEFLREAQVIISRAGMNIVGEDYLQRRAPGLADAFRELSGSIKYIGPANLHPLENQLRKFLGDKGFSGNYFYANTERKIVSGSLHMSYQAQLMAAVRAMAKLSRPAEPGMLRQFAADFTRRFEGRKIPLLQALDPDTGVGYGSFAEQAGAPALLKELQFPEEKKQAQDISWSAVHRMLLDKWNQASHGVIRLEQKDLESLEEPPGHRLPAGIAVMFRTTCEGLFIETAGGVTGTSLIGRFTPFSDEVHRFAREIAGAESGANPGIVFAEIGQLSDRYTDNVNRRLAVYDYEIPVNSVSVLPAAQQLRLDDLLVSVSNGEVILESRKLKKRVVPRLSSAYNFRHNSLAVYRFLCDLQYQGLCGNLAFDLESFFPGMAHYPRVEYQGIILSAEKWHLTETTGRIREKLGLPAQVALTRFDQQLVFNLDDGQQATLFEECIRGAPQFTLQEFFLPATGGSGVSAADGKPLVGQFIAFMANKQAVYRPAVFVPSRKSKIKRDFIPGSQWLYLKIYCTPALTDGMLVKKIFPVIGKVLKLGAGSWFFIRYTDPGPHIRLRVRINEAMTGEVMALFKAQFADLVSGQLIREYQADTYRRELERYGGDLIENVEQVFRASSELVIHFIKNNVNAGFPADHFAISSFELMLRAMIPALEEQVRFLEPVSAAFYAEFRGDKNLRVGLDKLYRELRPDFDGAISDGRFYDKLGIQKEKKQLAAAVEALALPDEKRKHALLADLIHMHLNRSYPDQQRRQEMVLYYCFYKYKLSALARSARSSAGVPPALEQAFLHGN